MSHVCPIHKSGDRSKPSNHCPVILVCNPEIYFERVVLKHFYNHLPHYNLVLFQAINQLIYLYNMFCQALDSGKEVRVVFCDASKAFERV